MKGIFEYLDDTQWITKILDEKPASNGNPEDAEHLLTPLLRESIRRMLKEKLHCNASVSGEWY